MSSDEKLEEQDEELAQHHLTTLSLDDPTQWSKSWTTLPDVYSLGLPHLDEWAATVDVAQPEKATEAFFPTIARYGRSYNLKNLSTDNPVRKLLEPQSSYLIPFDDVLLLQWNAAAPPISIATGRQFLELIDLYAKGRQFFDDDPTTQLEQLGLTESDFTVQEPWDQYPIVGDLLAIWNATGRYVNTYVDHAYPTDQDVQRDEQVQKWIAESSKEDGGNIRGLPAMDSRDALTRVLHGLIYRITAHGISRLYRSGNPVLTFVANFPPCLQDATIPDPTDSFDTQALHRLLPKTGTIGSMMHFYFIFWASPPYVSFVPMGGLETELFFDDEVSNEALMELRRFIVGFIENFESETPQIWQWERNIEL